MTKHTFAVGQTGPLRGGGTYRVICVDRSDTQFPLVALINHGGSAACGDAVCCYTASGMMWPSGAPHHTDLLPPPPKTRMVIVWVAVVQFSTRAAVGVYDGEDDAEIAASGPRSLMPDGKPLRIEIPILEEPRS